MLIMDEHISSLKDARQKYIDVLGEVLPEFNTAATDHYKNNFAAIGSVIHNLIEQHMSYRAASKKWRDFLEMRLREMEVHPHSIAQAMSQALADHDHNDMALDSEFLKLNEQLMCFLLINFKLRDFAQAQVLSAHTIAGGPSATEITRASQDNAQPRDVLAVLSKRQRDQEADMPHGDEAQVSKKYKTLVFLVLVDHDLNRIKTEETVEHKMAASQIGMHMKGKEYLESKATYGNVPNASEDQNMFDPDHSRLELEEAVEHNTTASGKTVEHHIATLLDLPDPDSNNNA